LKESTIYRRRERLRKMTSGSGLGDAYGATIDRIKAQGGDRPGLGMSALMCISHAERPLSADELCHAVAIELGSTNFNADNVPSMSTLLGCCQGLITVNKEASTVRLIHFTLQEYLSTSADIFSTPHSTMTEICLTYLNSEQIMAIPADSSPNIPNIPFLKHCFLYWGAHAKRELSDHARPLALQLLLECDGHISIKSFLEQSGYSWFLRTGRDLRFNGLHWASFFGVAELVAALIEMGCYDTDVEDFWGRTPLALAAENGHEEVVKILLERGEANPNKPDASGLAPISCAAMSGHGAVVKIFIGREDVNPHRRDNAGTIPITLAARRGHTEVVKILLAHQDVNPNKLDTWDATLLWDAAAGGNEGAAIILLGREEVNPDKPDGDGRTLLSHAAGNGHVGVIKILLGCQEINPNKPDNSGRTPFSHAAGAGDGEVVKILLGCPEINPEKSDNDGRTPLFYAAMGGSEEVVKMLLGCEKVNPNKLDNYSITALYFASGSKLERLMKMLRGREEVNPDQPTH